MSVIPCTADGFDDVCEPDVIPTTSSWGVIILGLLLAAAAKIRRHAAL